MRPLVQSAILQRMRTADELTELIIGAAIQVHKTLGPGLLERIYQDALIYELKKLGLKFKSEQTLSVQYKDSVLPSKFRLDLIVEDCVIVELKNCEELKPIHEAQLMTYLKITDKKVGLLLNFHALLMKKGIKRVERK